MKNKLKNILVNFIIPVLLFLIPFSLPLYQLSFDVSLFLTVVSLIFGVLVGFFIATATTNYLNLNNQLAEANSLLTIVYNLTKKLDINKGKQLAEAIDRYLIATIDYPIAEHAQNTEKEFNEIINAIDSIKLKKENSEVVVIYQNLHNAKADLFKKRQIIIQIAPKVITITHWFLILALETLIVLMLFSLRDGNAISNIFYGFIFICFYFLCLILYQVDSDEFLESQLGFEDVQMVFKSINKKRYYPQNVLNEGKAKVPDEDYRIGVGFGINKKVKLKSKKD